MESSLENTLWEDKEIKFDTSNLLNRLRNGEKVLDTIEYIEDTKGNAGDSGKLLATSLRLIWVSLVNKKYNLSIGWDTIQTKNVRQIQTKALNTRQALYILGIGGNTRFEFLFADLSTQRKDEAIFQSIFEIHQLYQRTYLYRDLKLRGPILQSGQLVIMPKEQVFSRVSGVMNLSSDQGNLGSFIVTNIRLVWFADANETFNISLPYLQISNIKTRESKYGPALVIQTAETGGGYVLGFRIDPAERLNEIFKELVSLHSIYSQNPNFGTNEYDSLEARKRNAASEENSSNVFKIDDFEEIDERQEREINSKLNTYLAEGSISAASVAREPNYCKELGFAMERLRPGYKLQDLWDVLPTTMREDV